MNDFTKEELEYLHGAIYERPNTVTEEMKRMRKKIQYMIENYCEHEYMTFLQDQNNEPFVEKCVKCHALRFCNDN